MSDINFDRGGRKGEAAGIRKAEELLMLSDAFLNDSDDLTPRELDKAFNSIHEAWELSHDDEDVIMWVIELLKRILSIMVLDPSYISDSDIPKSFDLVETVIDAFIEQEDMEEQEWIREKAEEICDNCKTHHSYCCDMCGNWQY